MPNDIKHHNTHRPIEEWPIMPWDNKSMIEILQKILIIVGVILLELRFGMVRRFMLGVFDRVLGKKCCGDF